MRYFRDPAIRCGSHLSDNELIKAALGGAQEAYFELFHRHHERLLLSLRCDLNCSESADDVVQDAFVRAFAKLDSFRCESSFYTWLFRIALNSRRNYMRNRHQNASIDFAAENMSWAEPETDPIDAVEAEEECDQVRAALARLDDHHREILLLREYEGCDYRAISQALDVTLGTVRSRLNRARAQLRKELGPYWHSTPPGELSQTNDRPWTHPDLSLTA